MFEIISGALNFLKRNEEVKEDKIIIKQHSEQKTVKAKEKNVVINKKNETSSQRINEQPPKNTNFNSRFLYAVIYQTEDFEQTFLYEHKHEADEMVKKIYRINRGKGVDGNVPYDCIEKDGQHEFYCNKGFHGDYGRRLVKIYEKETRIWAPKHPWAFAMVKEVVSDKMVKLEKKGGLIINGCISTENNKLRRNLTPEKTGINRYRTHRPYIPYYSGYSLLKLFNIRNYKQLKEHRRNLGINYQEIIPDKSPSFHVMCLNVESDVYTFLPYKKEGENIYNLSNSTYIMNRKEIRRKIMDEINFELDKRKEEEKKKALIESAKKHEEELLIYIDRHVNDYLDGDMKIHGENKIDRMYWLLEMRNYEKLKVKYNNNSYNKKFEIMDKILKENGISI